MFALILKLLIKIMKNNIKQFLDQLEKNNEFEIEKKKCTDGYELHRLHQYKASYKFKLCSNANFLFNNSNETLIDLDDEDINYFVTKYSPKL